MTRDPVSPDPKVMHRRALLQYRASLTRSEVASLSGRVCQWIANHPLFRDARSLGIYQATRNEVDPAILCHLAHDHGKELFLPVVQGDTMYLVSHPPGAALVRSPMGILEPRLPNQLVGGEEIIGRVDLLLLPLVGFDPYGGRLGYGGGFYDRFLEPLRKQRLGVQGAETGLLRPVLVGLAFAAQEVPTWLRAMHDVPLDFVATEYGFFPIRVLSPRPSEGIVRRVPILQNCPDSS